MGPPECLTRVSSLDFWMTAPAANAVIRSELGIARALSQDENSSRSSSSSSRSSSGSTDEVLPLGAINGTWNPGCDSSLVFAGRWSPRSSIKAWRNGQGLTAEPPSFSNDSAFTPSRPQSPSKDPARPQRVWRPATAGADKSWGPAAVVVTTEKSWRPARPLRLPATPCTPPPEATDSAATTPFPVYMDSPFRHAQNLPDWSESDDEDEDEVELGTSEMVGMEELPTAGKANGWHLPQMLVDSLHCFSVQPEQWAHLRWSLLPFLKPQ